MNQISAEPIEQQLRNDPSLLAAAARLRRNGYTFDAVPPTLEEEQQAHESIIDGMW